ncbi:MAG: outer membrane protein [Elusimicrobiota bacterium]
MRLISAGVAFLLAATVIARKAHAQRAVMPYASPVNWNGPYFGLAGGGGWGSSHHSDSTGFNSGSLPISGGLLGGAAGYNWQTGHIVFGAEGDMSWADIAGVTAGLPGQLCGGAASNCRTRLADLGTARGRIGYSFGSIMPYATAGLAFGDINGSEGDIPANGAAGSGNAYRVGWTVGAGIEDALAPHWSVKLEYLHVDLGAGPVFTDTFSNGSTVLQHVSFRSDIIRAGINYSF